jgi:hypothetical protein
MSRGSVETARGILEFFVDHLAAYEKAAAIAESLSPSAKMDFFYLTNQTPCHKIKFYSEAGLTFSFNHSTIRT